MDFNCLFTRITYYNKMAINILLGYLHIHVHDTSLLIDTAPNNVMESQKDILVIHVLVIVLMLQE